MRNGGGRTPGFWGELSQLVGAVGRAMGVTLRNFFRAPVTLRYPDVQRAYPDRFRGILALTYDTETGELNVYHLQAFVYQEVVRASEAKQTPYLKMPLAQPAFVVTQFSR